MGLLSRVQPQGKNFSASEKFFSTIHGLLQGFLNLSLIGLCGFLRLGGDISDIIAEMKFFSGATLNPTASAAVNPRSGPLAIENKTFWGLKSFFPSLPADRPLAIENKTFWGLKSFFSFLAC